MAPERKSAREATPATRKKDVEATKPKSPAKVAKTTSPATKKKSPAKNVGRKTSVKKTTQKQKALMANSAAKRGKNVALPPLEPEEDEVEDDDHADDDDPQGMDGHSVSEPAPPPSRTRAKKQSPKVKDRTYRDHHDPEDDAVEDEPAPEKPRRAGRKGSTYKPDVHDLADEDGDALQPPKRGRGRPRKDETAGPSPKKAAVSAKVNDASSSKRDPRDVERLSKKDATAALDEQSETVRFLRAKGAKQHLPSTAGDQDEMRKAYFMLKSALFGGGLYSNATKAQAKRLRRVFQSHEGEVEAIVVDPAREKNLLKNVLPWSDVKETGKREEDVEEYLFRTPHADLADQRLAMYNLGPWEANPQGLAEHLVGPNWKLLKACKYGMSVCHRKALEDLEGRWRALTLEDPDEIVLGGEKEEAKMRKRVKMLWAGFEEGLMATVGLGDEGPRGFQPYPEEEHEKVDDDDDDVVVVEEEEEEVGEIMPAVEENNPTRNTGKSTAPRTRAGPGHTLHNVQTRLASPSKGGTAIPSSGTKQRRETIKTGFSTTPKRGLGASSGRKLHSAEEAAASAAQVRKEMEEAGRVLRGARSKGSLERGERGGDASESSSSYSTSASCGSPSRSHSHRLGDDDSSDDESDHGFPHLPPPRRPSKRSISPAPPPPPDRSGITGAPVRNRERLQEVLRHVATAEEQRVLDGHENRVVQLPRKYYDPGKADERDNSGDDNHDGARAIRSPTKSPRPPTSRPTPRLKPARAPETEDPSKFTTATNPERISDLDRANPFHEKLPGPETWYQRMPNVFPFGETPWQEREMSRQINEDLARSHEREPEQADATRRASSSFAGRMAGAVRDTLFGRSLPRTTTTTTGGGAQTAEKETATAPAAVAGRAALPGDPWDVRELGEKEVSAEFREAGKCLRHVKCGYLGGREKRKRADEQAGLSSRKASRTGGR